VLWERKDEADYVQKYSGYWMKILQIILRLKGQSELLSTFHRTFFRLTLGSDCGELEGLQLGLYPQFLDEIQSLLTQASSTVEVGERATEKD